MSNKRDNKFKKTGISLLRLLVVITMVQYLFAGTLSSQAAPVADVDLVTGFDLLQSVTPPAWSTVLGSLGSGFTMTLDPTVSFYYLNVANLSATPDLKEGYHPFVVTATPPGFFAYWAGRGVCDGCGGTWEPVMWEIINGRQPIFYLKVDSGPSYMLVDGLTRATGGPDDFLRVNGSYHPGDYTFTGTITDTTEATSQLPVNITFKLIQYPLSVNKTGTGSGTASSTPAGIACGVTCATDFDYGTMVTLTATAATGSTFDGWNGEGCTGSGTCVVTMSAARSVTANFTLNQYTLDVSKTGSGTVSSNPAGIDCGSDCSEDYDYGTVVTLTATPDSGWGFFGWEVDLSGSTNPITLTIDGDKSVTAVFKQYFVYLPTVRRDPVFADDFNYADPDQVWLKWEQIAETSATWFIQDNEFHGKHIVTDRNAKAVAKVYAPQMPGSYSVEAKVKLESGSVEGARCGLLFDFLDNTRTYRFVIMPGLASGDNWLVQKRNPTLSQWDTLPVGTGRASMLSRNEYNLLRVVRQGASIKVYLNDMLTPLWSGSDSTFVNGRAGLNIGTPVGLVTGTYVEVIFDDFLIDNLR